MPTLVLLHAFPLDRRLWTAQADAVAADGWDVVVPDLRGFGLSRYPDDEDEPSDEPTLRAVARDVLGGLDRLGVARAVVGGLSLGGYVAMEILRQDPDRVAALVLADTKASADTPEAAANRLAVAEQVLAAGSTQALARAMSGTLMGPTTHEQRPEVVATVRGWIEEADPRAVAWMQRAMAVRPDSLPDLQRFTGPSLVMWGTEDEVAPRAEQDLMLGALRDARFAPVDGSGHLSAVERPAAVTGALLDFLAAVRRLPDPS